MTLPPSKESADGLRNHPAQCSEISALEPIAIRGIPNGKSNDHNNEEVSHFRPLQFFRKIRIGCEV